MQQFLVFLILLVFIACNPEKEENSVQLMENVSVEKVSETPSRLSEPLEVEILGDGYNWSEGPVWVTELNALLFSDVPENKIYIWREGDSVSEYLSPSGFTGEYVNSRETGSNGLAIDPDGKLVLCQHGDRRVAIMASELSEPRPEFETIVSDYRGARFNSPNDLSYHNDGSWYFTDPPYGLSNQDEDSLKELEFNGVYRIENDSVVLVIDSLTRPNGICFSPDGMNMYVANSDPGAAKWYRYKLEDNNIMEGEVLFDATSYTEDRTGLPDGMKTDSEGYIYATGPGGVFIFSPGHELIEIVRIPNATSNCALDPDGNYLYVTADNNLIRIKLGS